MSSKQAPDTQPSFAQVAGELEEVRNLLEVITETIPVGITLFDLDGNFTMANARAEAILGLSREEIVTRSVRDRSWHISAIDGQLLPENELPFHRVIDSNQPVFDVRFAIQGRNGARVALSINAAPIRNADGLCRGVVATFEEINALVEAEKALRESEERYRTLFNAMQDAFSLQEIICDENGKACDYRFLDVNPAFERMTGIPAKEWIGKRVLEILPDTEPYWIDLCGEVALTGIAKRVEQYAQAFGRHYEVLAYRPQPGQVAALCTDITERKHAEETILRRSRLDATATLAGGIAHDFNNLMVGVISNAELARMRWSDNAELVKVLDGVIEAGRQAGALARQMLTFARSGQHEPRLMRLESAIDETLGLQKRTLPPDIELTTEIAPALWSLRADHAQVVQVVMNLCINAAEAIERRGRITLEAHNIELPRPAPHAGPHLPPGRYVLLTLRDTGCGMDAKTRARLFEPFFSTKAHGRGLGLAAVHGIVQGHGGGIEVRSQPGEGTTFEVYLPATLDSVSVAPPTDAQPLGDGETILLIDDEAAVLEPTRANLELLGYRVLVAESGERALEIARSHVGDIRIAILDLSMPGMSGRDVFFELAKIRPHTQVLLCSGHDAGGDAKGLLEAGASGFVGKPFLTRDLAHRLHELVGK